MGKNWYFMAENLARVFPSSMIDHNSNGKYLHILDAGFIFYKNERISQHNRF